MPSTFNSDHRRGIRNTVLANLAVALSALLAGGCGDTADPPEPAVTEREPGDNAMAQTGTAQQFEELIQQYADARIAEREQSELRDVSAAAFLGEIAADRRLLEAVRAVDADTLDHEQRIDRRLVIGLLESSIYSAEKRRLWENDASIYVPANQVGRLLGALETGPAEKDVTAFASVLEKIPERVATGKQNLREPPKRYTEAAIFKTKGTIGSLEDIAASLQGEDIADGDLMASLATATDALREYERFLSGDLLPRSTGDWAIGKEHYDYILQHRWHLDADADEILARGKKAFEETEALAQEVSERIEPGKHWSEVYERLKDEHPAADGIKQAYQAQIDAAREFVIENEIVTLPEGERVITVDTPPAMRRSSPFGTFQSVDQFDDGLEGRLVLTPIEGWMTPEQQAERLRSHHDAWIPIIAVHEAYPGHHVDALKTRENPRVLRKVVREPIFSEGWGLFTEEMMYEQGFLHGDDVRLTQLRNRLWRAARVIMDVSLHTGSMTFEEAVDFLSEKVRFERYAAELEVGMYTFRPTYVLGYLIGMQEISAIRDDYIETFGEPSPPSQFYDPLLTVGALPPVLVRDSLFSADRLVEGLWSYTGLTTSDGQDLPLTGIFLFKDGVFVQQAVFDGEPFAEQGAMAHAGPYQAQTGAVHLVAEPTIGIAPQQEATLSFRERTEHDVSVSRSGKELTLVFGSGTVQEFEYLGPGAGTIHALEDGTLAFADDYFILVQGNDDGAVTGYGRFEKEGDELQLDVIRWSETDGSGARNRKDTVLQATFDGEALILPDGRRFNVR